MKSIEQYRRWLQAKLDCIESFPPENMNELDWQEARAIVEEAKEHAFRLKMEFATTLKAPPRQQLVELFNSLPEEINSDGLLDLATAADLLGYKPAGLRKVVKAGQIRHVQNGNGPIKFRREWIDEYIQANNPKGVERSPAKTKPKPPKSTIPGFNPKLFKN